MEERHKTLLRTNRLFLTQHLQPILMDVVDRLLISDVLNENMKQDIEAEKTAVNKARKLLDILPRRGPHAFNNFTKALCSLKEKTILECLDPEMAASVNTEIGVSPHAQPTQQNAPAPYKPTNTTRKPTKQPCNVSPVPVPVQHPVPAGSGGISNPSKEPKPKPSNVIGRQLSREIEKTEQPSEESLDEDLKDWPSNVDLTPKGIKVTIQDCTRQDLKKILSDNQVYDMQSSKKGRAVIVKNIMYEEQTGLKHRSNADSDAYRLENTLKRLRFVVKQYVNLSEEKLLEKLKREREEDHYDAFILVILSYGGVGTIMCTDGKEVNLRDILNVFTSKNCPSLKDKPKLFFIQACGTKFNGATNEGLSQPDDNDNKPEASIQDATDAMKSLALGGGDAAEDILQNSEDMLVAIATQPDVTSENVKYLSLFMLGLWTVLYKFSRNHHILELMEKINTLQRDKSGQPVKLCDVRQSLTKKFYFLPGYIGEAESNTESLSPELSLPNPNIG